MANNNNNKTLNVPNLRFPEFSGEWKKVRLGENCDIQMCKRILAEQTMPEGNVPFYKIGTIGGTPDAYISQALFDSYQAKYNYPRKGEILISCAGTVGRCVVFDGNPAYFQDSNIVWARNKEDEYTNDFLYYILTKQDWRHLNTTTIVRIYNDDLRALGFSCPSIIEQNKISTLLKQIDERISTQNKIIEDLKKLKSAIIDHIVGKLDNIQPLGNSVKVQGGFAFKSSEFQESGIPVIRISNIPQYSTNVTLDDCVYYRSGKFANYEVSNGQLLIAMSGATTGKTAIYSYKHISYLNQRVGCFKSLKEFYYPYLYVIVDSSLFINQLNSKLIAGAQPNISPTDIESILVPIPCLKQQKQIADSISSITYKINREERIMSLYKQNKSYLLQQMFI